MLIKDFSIGDIEEALALIRTNYEEERASVAALPEIDVFPDLNEFADNGLGRAAFENGRMVGFICCCDPWDNAFSSSAKGTFTPLHAHGAVPDGRADIYRRLYQAAAEKWVSEGITYHAVALYAHDEEAIHAFFTYGFGLRCMDAIRPAESIICDPCDGLTYRALGAGEVGVVRDMRKGLFEHLGLSPCFMYAPETEFRRWLSRADNRGSQLCAAFKGDRAIAFLELIGGGENFATYDDSMANICGAYALHEYRGTGVIQNLLNFAINKVRAEGCKSIGVDFESFNPTAYGLWKKHFTPYTYSVTRRIDECALYRPNAAKVD